MDLKIKEIDLEGERVFIKKSRIFGWGVVHPIKVDGKISWKNLISGGSWFKLISIGVLSLLILLAILEYNSIVEIANECLNKTPMFSFTP